MQHDNTILHNIIKCKMLSVGGMFYNTMTGTFVHIFLNIKASCLFSLNFLNINILQYLTSIFQMYC